MPDCIADGGSYSETIENSLKLTNGILNLDQFDWKENNGKFDLLLTVNGRIEIHSVNIISDYVDSEAVLRLLNKILVNSDYSGKNKFYELSGNVADFGVGFISENEFNKLAELDLIRTKNISNPVNEKKTESTDKTIQRFIDLANSKIEKNKKKWWQIWK